MDYRQIYIKSPNDLPTEEDEYYCILHSGSLVKILFSNSGGVFSPQWWLKWVKWYLQPIESQEMPTETELLTYFANHSNGYAEKSNEMVPIMTRSEVIKMIDWFKSRPAPKEELRKEQYPDTEADGYVFCGKCGALKGS